MGIPRLPKDAPQLVRTHVSALKKLHQAADSEASARQAVADAAGALIAEALEALLKTIPVEEINRDKRGIRVAALRSSGYETMLDLCRADSVSLEAVSGISQAGAQEIKEIAHDIAAQAEKDIKIRLSADNRSVNATALVKALVKYRLLSQPADICLKLLSDHEAPITQAISGLKPCLNILKWLFLSGEKKQLAHQCYGILHAADYPASLDDLLLQIRQAQFVSDQAAWNAFTEDPIPLFHILEQLLPGRLGNDDDVYGLPRELAREIQEEPFYPEGLRCELRRYQQWGVKYILHQGKVLLGDEMGLGKTVQAIAAMVSLRNTGGTHFLVICPASVIENWCREIRKHSDLPAVRVHGDHREEALQNWLQSGGVAVTNYETTKIFDFAPEFQFTMAVVDEAHYIKNPRAFRTQHVKEICTHAQRILFMTGTALENRVEEMVTLMDMLQPEVAASAEKMASLASAPQFRDLISPVYYRRRRDSVLTELPDLIETPEWCELQGEEELLYEEAVLNGRYTEARRVSWNVPDLSLSCKAQRMLEIIEDAREDGRKVIIFSFFLSTIEKIQALLKDSCMQPINGSVPVSRRQEIIDEFNAAPAGSVLLAQIQAGGTGLNIQCASVVILCEPQFKPSIENQAISRAYRMGQTRNVLVYRLLCEDTVDEEIMNLLIDKQAEFDAYADESSVGEESLELDKQTFSEIMVKETKRIEEKRRLPASAAEVPAP